ncbi:MAG: hypothetical protein ACREB5_12870, partial [Sphingomonadaceae bacterium]
MKLIRMRGAKSAGLAYMGRFIAICSPRPAKKQGDGASTSGQSPSFQPDPVIPLSLRTGSHAQQSIVQHHAG